MPGRRKKVKPSRPGVLRKPVRQPHGAARPGPARSALKGAAAFQRAARTRGNSASEQFGLSGCCIAKNRPGFLTDVRAELQGLRQVNSGGR